jgi:hypothetical protein
MSTVAPVIITIILAMYALAALEFARRSLTQHGRVRRLQTRPIASSAAGPAELAGKLVAERPIQTVDGPHAAVLRTEIELAYRRGNKTYRDPWAVDRLTASPCTIEDSSGCVAVAIDHVVVIGQLKRHSFTPEQLQAQRPDLWQLVVDKKEDVTEVRVRETYVPHDALAFASGELEAIGESTAGADYRDARNKLVLHGTPERPLILSGWPESQVRAELLKPAILFFGSAFLSLAVIVALWLIRAAIVNLAGIG